MGVMEKMRKSTGAILWVLIFSFGVLWLLADTQVFDAIQAGPRSLGSVNGDEVSMEEYNTRVSNYVEQYQQDGSTLDPEARANLEQQAWDDLVASKLIQQKMDDLGITVTDNEIVEMVTGDNPIPFIRQQFQRPDGSIDRQALQEAIEAPENSQIWLTIEQELRQQRRQQKMNNYVQSAMQVSTYDIEQEYIKENTTADIDYVRFPYAEISADEIEVSEEELRSYYEENKDRFHRNESYEFDFVSFNIEATREDTLRIQEEMENLREDFASAQDDSLFMVQYESTTPYDDEYVDKNELRDLYQPVLDVEVGEVTEPIMDDGTIYLLKKLDETDTEVQFAVLSQDIQADPIETIDAQMEEADDFGFFAEDDGFAEEAERRELELESGFATKGNDFVAGIGQSRQILSFLESANEGDISSPLELNDQILVVQLNEVIPEGPRPFEEVESQVRTTVINNKRKEQLAERVSELLAENESIDDVASAGGKQLVSVDGLVMSSSTIQGAGREPKVVGAIFGLEAGQQSGAIQGNNAVFVVSVRNRTDADLDNLGEDTRSELRNQLAERKGRSFSEIWLDELREDADIEDNRAQVLQ